MIKSEKTVLSKELADVRDEYPKLKNVSVESSYPRSSLSTHTGYVLKLLIYSKFPGQLEACLI